MPSKPIAHVPGVPYSSHNLSHTCRFTTRPGVLKPVLIDELVPGGRYRLDIGMIADTFPTENPLFGTYEIHTDVFLCPLKNWYATLHTNFPGVDYTPDSIRFHYIRMTTLSTTPNDTRLSLSNPTTIPGDATAYRFQFIQQFPALPDSMFDYLGMPVGYFPYSVAASSSGSYPNLAARLTGLRLRASATPGQEYLREFNGHGLIAYYDIFRSYYVNPQEENFLIYGPEAVGQVQYDESLGSISTTSDGATLKTFAVNRTALNALYNAFGLDDWYGQTNTVLPRFGERYVGNIVLQSVPLRSLVDWLNTIYTSYTTSSANAVDLINSFTSAIGPSSFGLPGAGFCVRTYRPDLLTSWISQDGIEKVRTASSMKTNSEGVLTYEQILTGQKVYDYSTHTQLSGGRYKDWVRAIYRVTPNMDSDQPILLSHSRTRMDFQGIFQNSSTETDVSPLQQRTALGGSVSVGSAQSVGDSIVFDCTQPSILVVMSSVVPIADYSQGVDPMLLHTNFKSMYSPDYDGIGWQPLTTAMLAPQWDSSGSATNPVFQGQDPFTTGIGYQPSWEEYRSRVNRVHGDFHDTMANYVLKRVFPAFRSASAEPGEDPTPIPGDGRFYSSYILPSMYTSSWAVKNGDPFRIQYAFGYRSRLPMSKYSLPKIA